MNLKETFEFLGVEAGDPPPDLAGRALSQLRWNRSVKVATALVTAMVAVTAVVVGSIWPDGATTPPPPANPPGVPALPPTHEWWVGGFRLGGWQASSLAGTHLLDPQTRTYRKPAGDARISPDGRRAVYPRQVNSGAEPQPAAPDGMTDQVTIVDLATDHRQVVPLPLGARDFAWSPDGRSIVGTVITAVTDPATNMGRRVGFYLIGAGDGRATFVPVDKGACTSGRGNSFGWRLGELYATSPGADSTHCTLTYFGPDGAERRSLTVPGGVMSVSPDGGMLLVERDILDKGRQFAEGMPMRDSVVDARTGIQRGAFRSDDGRSRLDAFAWLDGEHLFARQEDSRSGYERLVAIDVNGHVTRVLSRWGARVDLQFIPVGP